MLSFAYQNKKRRRQGLNMEQKRWICEGKKTEPAFTDKNLALLFFERFKVSLDRTTS